MCCFIFRFSIQILKLEYIVRLIREKGCDFHRIFYIYVIIRDDVSPQYALRSDCQIVILNVRVTIYG
ncbi:MAG: hypothetical protein RBG13Loki_3981 [Promethearchaeota archaeon CR_4]|nr:MAG: hypothetical protein RBG13Loki_3981 [Candidatus Lokiarchaeota archaeon CR_4]